MKHPAIDKMKSTFAYADSLSAEDLAAIYTSDIVFIDPLGRIEGLDTLTRYFKGVYKNVTQCRFDYLDELVVGNKASIKWDMFFNHPRLASASEIVVRGVSLIEFGEKIHRHEDVYDVGALMYENVPLLGKPVRWLKNRAHTAPLAGSSG